MKVEEIVEEASKLSQEEQRSIVSELLRGLDPPVYEVSDEEVHNRVREGEEDPSVLISSDELEAGLKRRGS